MPWYKPLSWSWFTPRKTPLPGEVWEIRVASKHPMFPSHPTRVIEVLTVDSDWVRYKILDESHERESKESIRQFRAHYTLVEDT